MARKPTEQDWVQTKRLCKLTDDDVRMAKQLGFMPWSLTKNNPSPRQSWKLPVAEWIRTQWAKRLAPEKKLWEIEQDRYEDHDYAPVADPVEAIPMHHNQESLSDVDARARRKQARYREAAHRIAALAAGIPWIDRVEVFGSVAVPLTRERPEFRWRGTTYPLWDVKNLNLAVWVTDLSQLDRFRRDISAVLSLMSAESPEEPGVAHHAIDMFLMEAYESRFRFRYRGRLCHYGHCPKADMDACLTPGCGAQPFLRQFDDFRYDFLAFFDRQPVVLFDRADGGLVEDPRYPTKSDRDRPRGLFTDDGDVPF